MKILFASSSSGSRGGGELFLVYLGKALQQCGHELTLWVSSHPRMDEVSEKFAHIGKVVRANYTNTYDRAGRSLAAAFDLATARSAARLHSFKQTKSRGWARSAARAFAREDAVDLHDSSHAKRAISRCKIRAAARLGCASRTGSLACSACR